MKPKCTECGICCLLLRRQDVFCNMRYEELNKIPKKYHRFITHFSPFDQLCNMINGNHSPMDAVITTRDFTPRRGPLKGFDLCACAMLRGTPLKKAWCAIYKNRPKACHEALEPGDSTCKIFKRHVDRRVASSTKDIFL